MIQSRMKIIIGVFFIILAFFLLTVIVMSSTMDHPNTWAFKITQIDDLQSLGYDGTNVRIGIIDTGVDLSHQEFSSSSLYKWNDSVNAKQEVYDDSDHGTHIFGMLAATGSFQGVLSGISLQGIAPGAEFMMIKAISQSESSYGTGNDTRIAQAIQECISQNVDIILLSLGHAVDTLITQEYYQTIQQCESAIQHGIYIVIPAGNDGNADDGEVIIPATLSSVITVGAIDKNNNIASFSSQGHQFPYTTNPNKKPEIVAPGVEIFSTRSDGAYGSMSGTEQSATYVAGILALVLDAYPEFKPGGVKNSGEHTITMMKEILISTAKKIGNLEGKENIYAHDDHHGYGLIQGLKVYEELGKY